MTFENSDISAFSIADLDFFYPIVYLYSEDKSHGDGSLRFPIVIDDTLFTGAVIWNTGVVRTVKEGLIHSHNAQEAIINNPRFGFKYAIDGIIMDLHCFFIKKANLYRVLYG